MKKPIMVLSYHHLDDGEGEPVSPLQSVYRVKSVQFREQMEAIKAMGLEVLPYQALFTQPQSSKRGVIITFDDGNLSDFTLARPILKEFGFPWTIFLSLHSLNREITWEQLKQLREEGVYLALHGSRHQDYTLLNSEDLKEDFHACSQAMIDNLQHRSLDFALPFGRYNYHVLTELRKLKVRGVATTRYGWNIANSGHYLINRWAIRRTTSIRQFRQILAHQLVSHLYLKATSSLRHWIMQLIGSKLSNKINVILNKE